MIQSGRNLDLLTTMRRLNNTRRRKIARENCMNMKKLYMWRKRYLHCSNLYYGYYIETKGTHHYDDLYMDHPKEPSLFYNGNFLFFSNPFDPSLRDDLNISLKLLRGIYDSVKVTKFRHLSPDDIADGAFEMYTDREGTLLHNILNIFSEMSLVNL